MKRVYLAHDLPCVALIALALAACADPGGGEDDGGSTGVNLSTSGSTSGSGSSSSSSSSSSGGETGESSTSGGKACASDDECPAGEVCEEGVCGFCVDCCGEAVLEMKIVTPNVVLVLDKSGSMVNNTWDADADPNTPEVTRWYSLYNVVEFIAGTFDGSMNLGMQLFPSLKAKTEYSAAACPVEAAPEVPVAAQNGAAVMSALPGEAALAQIAGGTPARLGLAAAIAHLEAIDDGLPKFIVFVTDGAANCSPDAASEADRFEVYDDAVHQVVADAHGLAGIGVFVVGIDTRDETSAAKPDGNPDGVNTFAKLNDLAIAGGHPKDDPSERFYNARNQIELQAALDAIKETLLDCTIALDPVPKYPNMVEVKVDGVDYGKKQVSDCAAEDGWMYTSPAKDAIVLCGQACVDFQQSGKLDAQYKCPTSG